MGVRLVQTGGDSLLIVFDSIDGAVRCAIKVQQQVPVLDGDRPPDGAIRFRVGINLGDAIPDGSDLHGDAVNVVARLQVACPPGGICVSRSVRDHVHGRLGLKFEELGALNLKNIARPVEAYLVRPITPAIPKSVERSLVHGAGEALPLPDKPSIAVLAFNNMSDDTEQEYFSDGICEDIIAELSRSRSLFVIARNSSFTYKGRAVDVRQVGCEMGVRYVLEGSVRRSGARVRIVAQLIDATAGNHIWADRYDRALEDVFKVQDEITSAVVTAVIPAIANAELTRILRKAPESLDAWEVYNAGFGMWPAPITRMRQKQVNFSKERLCSMLRLHRLMRHWQAAFSMMRRLTQPAPCRKPVSKRSTGQRERSHSIATMPRRMPHSELVSTFQAAVSRRGITYRSLLRSILIHLGRTSSAAPC